MNNDLMKEFSERCQSASRSLQGYINADDPAPDDDTLLTLIETNDQLTLAISKYQRAVLQARKAISSIAATPSPPAVLPAAPPAAPPAQKREDTNLDPFRDENRIMPTTQQAPLSATIQGPSHSAYYEPGLLNRAPYQTSQYTSTYDPMQTYSQEPFHPGHMPAERIMTQQPSSFSDPNFESPSANPPADSIDHPAPQRRQDYSQRQISAAEHTTMRGAIGN